jgi:hypothetical protein
MNSFIATDDPNVKAAKVSCVGCLLVLIITWAIVVVIAAAAYKWAVS